MAEEKIRESELLPEAKRRTHLDYVLDGIRTGVIPPEKILAKIREVDRSGNACEWVYHGEEDECFYMFPQDKIAGIFMSDRLPDWWKRKKLEGNGRGVHGDVCTSFIPTYFDNEDWKDGLDEHGLALLETVYNSAPMAASCNWNEVRGDLEKIFYLHPYIAQTTHDMFGNNALHYCYAGYMECNGAGGYWPGEWSDGAMKLSHFLIEHGCSSDQENDFGIAFRQLHFACETEEKRIEDLLNGKQ